jgi:hypothetical protein
VRLALVALALSSIGCATFSPLPRASLPPAPSLDASFDERVAYFHEMAPATWSHSQLILRNGTVVYWPEDLAPAVDQDADAAKLIASVHDARAEVTPLSIASEWLIVGGAVVGAGAVVSALGYAFVVPQGRNIPVERDPVFLIAFSGAAVGAGGTLTSMVLDSISEPAQRRFEDGVTASFATYGIALADRLGLRVAPDGRVIDARASATAPPASTSTEPSGGRLSGR